MLQLTPVTAIYTTKYMDVPPNVFGNLCLDRLTRFLQDNIGHVMDMSIRRRAIRDEDREDNRYRFGSKHSIFARPYEHVPQFVNR